MPDNNQFGFELLDIWKKVRDFKNEIRQLTKTFPSDEKFRLTDQLIRSSRSINALISEGHGDLPILTRFIIAFRQEAL